MKAMEFLSQAYLLNQQIETNLRQIESLRSLAQSLQSFIGNEPVNHTRNVTSLQDTVIKIMEQEQKLNAEIDRLVDLKTEIQEVISRVKETNLREILKKRHLCFETWPQIGKELGHTDRWAQLRHERALIVVQKILDEREAEQAAG